MGGAPFHEEPVKAQAGELSEAGVTRRLRHSPGSQLGLLGAVCVVSERGTVSPVPLVALFQRRHRSLSTLALQRAGEPAVADLGSHLSQPVWLEVGGVLHVRMFVTFFLCPQASGLGAHFCRGYEPAVSSSLLDQSFLLILGASGCL